MQKILINGKQYFGDVDFAIEQSNMPDFPRINLDLHGSITVKLKKDEARKFRRFIKKHYPTTRLKRLRNQLSAFLGHRISWREARRALHTLQQFEKNGSHGLIWSPLRWPGYRL
jgi:hypothetical protein